MRGWCDGVKHIRAVRPNHDLRKAIDNCFTFKESTAVQRSSELIRPTCTIVTLQWKSLSGPTTILFSGGGELNRGATVAVSVVMILLESFVK